MCAEPMNDPYMPVVDQCPDCGADVDSDGDSVTRCAYSEVQCETCGDAPCDGSC